MDSIKVAENLAAGSVVKEVQIILENGGEANYSIALVSGKFAIDNAKFSFDVDGNIINNNILASGIYWIRYRATVGFNSVEKGLKIYTDDQEVEITLSSTEYPSDILNGEVVSTVSLSSGSTTDVIITPQSDSDDAGFPAFDYDGASGEIRWSGNQTPEPDPAYSYVIQYTGECIKPSIVEEFTATVIIPLDLAPCASPGTGLINNNRSLVARGNPSFGANKFTEAKVISDDINSSIMTVGAGGINVAWIANSGGFTFLDRGALRFDLSGGTASMNISMASLTNMPAGEKAILFTITGDIETGRTNALYDMATWTVLGIIELDGSYDISGLVPAATDVWIGYMWLRDFQGDFGVYDVSTPISANIGNISQLYKCP